MRDTPHAACVSTNLGLRSNEPVLSRAFAARDNDHIALHRASWWATAWTPNAGFTLQPARTFEKLDRWGWAALRLQAVHAACSEMCKAAARPGCLFRLMAVPTLYGVRTLASSRGGEGSRGGCRCAHAAAACYAVPRPRAPLTVVGGDGRGGGGHHSHAPAALASQRRGYAKELRFGVECRNSVLAGADKLADAVQVTLGPKVRPRAASSGARCVVCGMAHGCALRQCRNRQQPQPAFADTARQPTTPPHLGLRAPSSHPSKGRRGQWGGVVRERLARLWVGRGRRVRAADDWAVRV